LHKQEEAFFIEICYNSYISAKAIAKHLTHMFSTLEQQHFLISINKFCLTEQSVVTLFKLKGKNLHLNHFATIL